MSRAVVRDTLSIVGQLDAAEDALRTLAAQLDALDGPDMLERAWPLGDVLEAFGVRFGRRPQDLAAWDAVQLAASRALARAKPPVRRVRFDSGEVGYATLTAIVGQTDDALAWLDRMQPIADGHCGNAQAGADLPVFMRRAAILELEGRFDAALEALDGALANASLALGATPDARLHAWRGFVAARCGDGSKAMRDYQRVIDLFPDAEERSFCERELVQSGAFAPPSCARILKTYVYQERGHVNFVDRGLGIRALGAHRFPEAFEWLSQRFLTDEGDGGMSRWDDDWLDEQQHIAAALRSLGEERATALLRTHPWLEP